MKGSKNLYPTMIDGKLSMKRFPPKNIVTKKGVTHAAPSPGSVGAHNGKLYDSRSAARIHLHAVLDYPTQSTGA